MLIDDIKRTEDVLLEIVGSIEISESKYEKAVKSYNSVGEWLNRDASILKNFNPKVYPQGSFRLGTAIKPITEDDEYDVDIVCEVNLSKERITQKMLKDCVGQELDKYSNAYKMQKIEEGKRCWTLDYADEAKFHIDVLPAIPDSKSLKNEISKYNYSNKFVDTTINITDNTLGNYNIINSKWNYSNPIGYHEWFKEQMKSAYEERRGILRKTIYKNRIEEIPDYKIKTPLQQVIQLLKRHRDIMFEEDETDSKPISIIISTLAAKSYSNENSLLDAFNNIIYNMDKYIELKGEINWVTNPVNPLENFADKWEHNPNRKESFFKWIKQLQKDYSDITAPYKTDYEKRNIYEEMFGKSISLNNYNVVSNIPKDKLSHRKPSKWSDSSNLLLCKIIAFKASKGFRYSKFDSGEPLRKNINLRFEVKVNTKQKFKTFWRVTNTGEEALMAKCMRGGFYDEKIVRGRKVREESTLYKGCHTVEIFLVKNDICIGRSEPFIVNIV